ncbi:ist1-like protein [Quercus suber]|uniref:Ist1-like protein n=1 Tax=Quercus suber TaxID=58331 RepID=A0AAW0LTE0_QUESU
MFDILFGWRKASKCKKLIKRVQCRLKGLKNKRNSIVRQIRGDVAQLIKTGHEQIAFTRVEQLIKDESIVALYELLDHFCESILVNLSYIRKHKDRPNDINEAVSSLIYASARCGDLPELLVIRKLFGERYGQKFALTAVELLPGNLVNREIIEKLSQKSVPEDVKHRLIDEIARDYSLKPEVLALEYYPEWKQEQVKENSGHQVLDTDVKAYYDATNGSEMQASSVEEIERKVIYVDSLSTSNKILTEPCNSLSHQDSDMSITFTSSIVHSANSSIVRQSSSGSGDQSNMNHYESWSEKSGSRSSRKRGKASGKRLRRRSMSREIQSVKDIECLLYYDNLRKSSPTHHHIKHHKQNPGVGRQQSYYSQKRFKKPCCLDLGSNFESCNCSLRHPIFYFCTYDDEENGEVLPWKQKRGSTTLVSLPTHGPEQELVCNECYHHHWSWNRELDKEMEWNTFFKKPRRRRSYDSGAAVYDVFTYPDFLPNKQHEEMKGKADRSYSPSSCVSSNISSQRVTSAFTRKETLPPYSRAETMPAERLTEARNETILRSNSCPFQHPNHVHPKLPNCDDIEAKFRALKKEVVQNKSCGRNIQLV